ncbi:MAG: hypothetical protein ACREF1_14505 [Acetobacteraceae bacterium]
MAKDPKADTRPATKTHVDLVELKNILGRMVKNQNERKELFTDPAKALEKMNYHPDPGAVEFIKSLRGSQFEKPGTIFKHHNHDPALGMAEN